MYWPPDDRYPYDETFAPVPPLDRVERLHHLVFLDGRLVDSWTQRVEGTRYRALADEFDSERHRAIPTSEPIPPLHEKVLAWLDGVVGGRRALMALDDEPLTVTADPAPEDPVETLLARVADELFDDEFLYAARAVLTAVREVEAAFVADTPDAEIAGAICWLVGRANGLVGQGTSVNQKVLKRVLWLSASPSRRAPRIKAALRGLRPGPCVRPADCPDLLELGDVAFLTSATRRRLITLRDRALEVAEELEADRQAREALAGAAADSLTP